MFSQKWCLGRLITLLLLAAVAMLMACADVDVVDDTVENVGKTDQAFIEGSDGRSSAYESNATVTVLVQSGGGSNAIYTYCTGIVLKRGSSGFAVLAPQSCRYRPNTNNQLATALYVSKSRTTTCSGGWSALPTSGSNFAQGSSYYLYRSWYGEHSARSHPDNWMMFWVTDSTVQMPSSSMTWTTASLSSGIAYSRKSGRCDDHGQSISSSWAQEWGPWSGHTGGYYASDADVESTIYGAALTRASGQLVGMYVGDCSYCTQNWCPYACISNAGGGGYAGSLFLAKEGLNFSGIQSFLNGHN